MVKTQAFEKNFIILLVGQIISIFGSSIQRVALSYYLLDITGSASLFASILAISMIPVVVLAPLAGIFADRGNKKKLMVVLDLSSGVLLLGYLFIFPSLGENVKIIAVVMVILSAISTVYQPIVQTSIPLVVEKENLTRASALIQQVSSANNFVCPILAGMLYGFLGIKVIIMLNLISFILSAIMELFLKIPHKKDQTRERFFNILVSDVKESFSYLIHKNLIVFRMLLFSGLYNLCLVPVFSVVAPYLIKISYNLSSQTYGIVEGAIALGMILGGLIIAWKPKWFHIRRVHRLLYIAAGAMCVMGVVTFFTESHRLSILWGTILFAVSGLCIMGIISIANVLSATFFYKEVGQNMLGKVLAFGSAFATICVPMGQVIFGSLVEHMKQNLSVLLMIATGSVFLVTILVRWNVLKIKSK